jgi:hypothetical protein
MAQSYLMVANDHFEQQKNMKAGAYTGLICLLLAILFVFASWQLPKIAAPDPPLDQQGIEVNLGTDETGFGTDQSMLPGDPAPQIASAPASQPVADNANDDVNSDENEAENVPIVKKTEKPKPAVTKNTKVIKQPTTTTKTVVNTSPASPKPKAVFNGKTAPNSNGNGGNGADSYYKGSNQGIAGGKGDQGAPGGNPNSDSYKGNGKGGGGVNIRSGLDGRRIAKIPAFEDDFNENAKVAVDVVVDGSGNVVSASVNPRGTTTTNGNIRSIAIRKAKQLKFNAANDDEQNGTLVFDFKLKG